MVQMMDLPPWAKAFIRDTTWKQDALSKPLEKNKNKTKKSLLSTGNTQNQHMPLLLGLPLLSFYNFIL